MLDAFKKTGATKVQSDELQSLIAASKEERAALSTMLTQVQLHSAKLASAGKSLQEVEEKADKANTRLDEVTERLAKTATRTTRARGHRRAHQVADRRRRRTPRRRPSRLTAPDGELQKHKQALQSLSSQALQTRASLDTLKKDQAALDELREHLRQAQAEIKTSHEKTEGLKGEFDQLRSDLRPAHAGIHQAEGHVARDARRGQRDGRTGEGRREAARPAGASSRR